MGKNATIKEKARYWFENTLSGGAKAIIMWLAIISVIIVLVFGMLLYFTKIKPDGGDALGFAEALWQSLMRTMDSGNVAGDNGWVYRGIMGVVTLGGIFIVSSFIGALTSGLQNSIEELRKGRSKVLESNHTFIS